MNKYTIKWGGDRSAEIQGVNLETALVNFGFTNIEIVPLWRGTSNGKYKAYCNECAIVLCYWTKFNHKEI